jgi:prevent-host-death family protein
MKTIAAGEFKAKCLSLLDEVNDSHETFVVTKRGVPVAKLSPISKNYDHPPSLHGSVLREKDIVEPIGDTWEVDR